MVLLWSGAEERCSSDGAGEVVMRRRGRQGGRQQQQQQQHNVYFCDDVEVGWRDTGTGKQQQLERRMTWAGRRCLGAGLLAAVG